MDKEIIIIGYSGHAYVVCDIFASQNMQVKWYCDFKEKDNNPYQLKYLGQEDSDIVIQNLQQKNYFIAIGNNNIRKNIIENLKIKTQKPPINAIHKNSSISTTTQLGHGIMVGDGSIINACSKIEDGVICNTQSVIEHECTIGAYSHIAPGAVLCGNVKLGKNSFIGAKAVIKEGVQIGENVIIGAGTVVIRNIADNQIVVGNPQRKIK